tara:strand:+ start:724 stop:1164 length:441 start_codon:yes stop_codon:yes gene_type:complete
MDKDKSRPFVLFVAEIIYCKISKIKKNNPDISTTEAFERFISSNDYNVISSGEFHNKWFRDLKYNNFIDKETGNEVSQETLRLLNIQKDTMIKQLIKIPKLYYAKSHFPLELSQRAFEHLWRICESYELWCKETKQTNLITLNLLD